MQSIEFLKSLIQLLVSHGGTFTCQLSELQQLGLELSLQNLSSDNSAMFTLRLGARIYYVPAKETTECPTPTNQLSSQPQPLTTGQTESTESLPEVMAATTLNNHLPQQSASPHRPVVRNDLDLYLLEQNQVTKRTAQASRQAQELRDATRQYPWETRKQ
jgi:hypothetical protein